VCSLGGLTRLSIGEEGYREANKGGGQECKDDQKLYPCVQSASPLRPLGWKNSMRGGGRGIIIASSKGEERHNQRNGVIGSVVDRDSCKSSLT
jgi:hypothetical protein